MTESLEALQDRTPPTVRIIVERLGEQRPGDNDIGRVGHGAFQLRLDVKDDQAGVLDTFYRIGGHNWQRYEGIPVPITSYGSVMIEAYSTDRLRNKTKKMARRKVRLVPPERLLRVWVEYKSGEIIASLRTYEGLAPEPELLIEYSLDGGVPCRYDGGPIRLPYGTNPVRLTYQIQSFAFPHRFHDEYIMTQGIQEAVWGNGKPLSAADVADLIAKSQKEAPEISVDGVAMHLNSNIHAFPKAEILGLAYPMVVYQVHLKPTYECYIEQHEIVAQAQPVHAWFEMHDDGKTITYPDITVRLLGKKQYRHTFVGTVVPRVTNDRYEFFIDPESDLPPDGKEFRIEFWDYRGRLRSRSLLIK